MDQETYNFWSLIVQTLAFIAAAIFALWQIKINERLKKLQDYVALTLVPSPEMGPKLNIMNVGKINVYLQKYEIGTNHESFAKSLLIPAGSESFLALTVNVFVPKQRMDVTLYMIDEHGQKFISTGEVIVDNVPVIIQPQIQDQSATAATTQQTIIVSRVVVAHSYQTIKKNWIL